MKLWARHLFVAAAATAAVWLIGIASTGQAAAQGQETAAGRPPAGQFFKNVSTSTLKVLGVDDFMGAMGVMAAALGFDCSDCHPGAGSDTVDWVIDTPKKVTARKMVEMVAVINKNNFGGAGLVTCWTCHHGREVPATTIALDHLYGAPNDEKDDIVQKAPDGPTAVQILDKYVAALGGAAKLNTLKSFLATGTSVGYEKLGGGGTFQIAAKFPDQHLTSIVFKDRPERGDSTRVYDGKTGWIKTPRALLKRYELAGGELDGARFDALLCFPSQIKTALTNLRVGYTDSINDKDVDVVQGTGPRGLLVTLYFDKKTGLLVRYVRFARSPIGRVPVQVDYADYRDVGGIKFPFQYTFSWLDGKDAFQLTDVKVNIPLEAAKFAAPAP